MRRLYNRLITWGCLLLLVLVVAGCDASARQIQAQTANATATAANSMLPLLVERYRNEGTEAILAVKAADGTAAEARAAVEIVKAKWAPVWKAWETLRIAQNAWATALENGGDTLAALGAMKTAYCGLQAVWPKDIPAVPLAPLTCAGANHEPQ